MLNVEIQFDSINISNIEKSDIPQIHEWMQIEKQFEEAESNLVELKERFLESYISECEFFLKISEKNLLIGIIKGRLEFKNPNEVWIWFFYLNDRYKSRNLNTKIIEELMNYFSEEYGIDIFFTRLMKNDRENLKFWESIGFKTIRMIKDFYKVDEKHMDMLIMRRFNSGVINPYYIKY